MAKPLVPDELWTLVEPLLPPVPDKPFGGRPPVANRAALGGILFVLKTGIPWAMLPTEMGCGSGTTCWRRLRDWHQAGVWQRLHETLLTKLEDAGRIEWERASVDSARVTAPKGGSPRGQTRYEVIAQRYGSRQTGRETPSCGRPERPAAGALEHGSHHCRLQNVHRND